ncbi:NAD-dependent epimerase/dehydratase family protein [Lentilactobacillus sp. Marseille-Q4993]|uniref:NAD-dependent epimerase/dehydratase family protein n=1 Tax=Lentilactobacillus sp. Marseille-Q4993 TaxID=3039492 RepID=UPI0024BCE179|nr:NAD-dependent epimerase/dehydratase family protein [Lentilactobacillus sp. Marseille-Q4993]
MIEKVLVTGGAGFIGSTLVNDLLRDGYEVTVVDDLSMGLKENLPANTNLTFYEKSITDYDFMGKLLIDENFDYIFLLAAVASVADTIERPAETHEINQNANLFVLETLRLNQLNPKKVMFTSSAAVYGNDPELPKTETSRIVPLSPYAVDKFATERSVINYGTLYGMNTAAVRFFNVYGPRRNPSSPYSGVLSLISSKLKDGTEFTMLGDGQQSRDFVFVEDVVSALRLIARTHDTNGEVYNVATGSSISLLDTIKEFEKVADRKLQMKFADERKGDIKYSSADINKLKAIGYEPKYSLAEGLEEYWRSLK